MIKTFRLPNGITCVCDSRPGTGTVDMSIGLRYGTCLEGAAEQGVGHMILNTLLTDDHMAEAEATGGSLSGHIDDTSMILSADALARDADHVFAVLSDALRNPAFDPAFVKRIKKQTIMSIDEGASSIEDAVHEGFMMMAFMNQTVSAVDITAKKNIRRFTPDDLRIKHAQITSNPEQIVLSFSGDLTLAQAKAMARTHFGDMKAGPTPFMPAAPLMHFTGGEIASENDNEQLVLSFGFPAPSLNDPKHHAFHLLEDLLGGGMSAPLFQEIREKRGLVYTVQADYVPLDSSGYFAIHAGTGANATELLQATIDLLGQKASEGFTQQELDRARSRIMRKISVATEAPHMSNMRNMAHLLNYGRVVPLDEIEASLARVTSVDIQIALTEMLGDGRYALSCSGPMDTMPSAEQIADMLDEQAARIEPFDLKPRPSLSAQFNAASRVTTVKPSGPHVTVLDNGLTIVTTTRPGTVSCGAWVGAGAAHETPELSGATHMNEHMMFRGTTSFGPGEVTRIVENEMAGGLNAYTSKDQTAYTLDMLLPDHLDRALDVCGELVFKANLDHTEYAGGETTKGERSVVLEEIKKYDDMPAARLDNVLDATMYPGQSYGRPVLGTASSLNAISAADLTVYRDEYYVPNNVVFSVTGPVKHADVVHMIAHKYGNLQSRDVAPLPTPDVHGALSVTKSEIKDQCMIMAAFNIPPKGHADTVAYEALSTLLVGSALARLPSKLVDEMFLTLDIEAYPQQYPTCGQFCMATSTAPQNTRLILSEIFASLRDVRDTLDQGELDMAKAQMEMNLMAGAASNSALCNLYGEAALYGGTVESLDAMSARVQALTLADVRRVTDNLLKTTLCVALDVPKGIKPAHIPTYADILTLRDQPFVPEQKKGKNPGPATPTPAP
ncbi:M16 family metallopeptidase [Micavibrio aeruginosavorus]|uniref:M16 family metallopeptidase n=1 Tax=Micavibrio aeruginosavorus TaxID=349221 RepID=UPI003F4A95E4